MLITDRLQSFAQLSRLISSGFADFAEAVTNSEALAAVKELLESEMGNIDRLFDVTIDGETFRGKAEQKVSLARSQIYDFTLSPEEMSYKAINSADMAEYAETDNGWAEILEYAGMVSKSAKASKKLNCKPGNMQCGGRCQNASKNCRYNPTPEQSEAVKTAAKKAKGEVKPLDSAKKDFSSANWEKTSTEDDALSANKLYTATIDGKKYFAKQVSEAAIKKEIAAYKVAQVMGVEIPEPSEGIVNGKKSLITPFIELKSVGAAENQQDLQSIDKAELGKIIAFDYLIGNVDRGINNVFLDSQKRPVIIDHDKAFSSMFNPKTREGNRGLLGKSAYWTETEGFGKQKTPIPADSIKRLMENKATVVSELEARGINPKLFLERLDNLASVETIEDLKKLGK